MSICDEGYNKSVSGFSERIATSLSHGAYNLVQAILNIRDTIVRMHRLRTTESALDLLPDNIREDIGWPDLYERQVTECNDAKRWSNQ